ncbi:MAG: hypothetical protein M3R72_05175, partial [Bacteroidota bacterium]|nr:hypothetical protein [Bacteroidota bacterium]
MKTQLTRGFVFAAFLLCITGNVVHAQLLKSVLNSVKQTGQNRANGKVDQITNKVLDKVDNLGKNKSKNTADNKSTSAADTTKPVNNNAQPQSTTSSSSNNSSSQQSNEYNSGGSFIHLNLSSDRIIAGGAVQITGSSIRYQNFNSVAITITTQDGAGKESRTLSLDTSGAYSTIWQLMSDGDYIVYAKSSDGKSTVSKRLGVFKPEDIDSVIQPLKSAINRASDKLNEDIDKVKSKLTGQDA